MGDGFRNRKNQREEYINQLRNWQWDAHLHACKGAAVEAKTNMIRDSVVQAASVNLAAQVLGATNPNFTDIARNVTGNQNVISRERQSAGLLRRISAVLIDWATCFTLMIMTIAMMYTYKLVALPALTKFYLDDMQKIGLNPDLDLDSAMDRIMSTFEQNIDKLEEELVIFTICFKLLIVLYETIFIWFFGFTFGKLMMGVEVIHYGGYARDNNQRVPDVMVVSGQTMGLFRSFCRSVLKVLYFTIMFPLVLFFQPFNARGNQFYDVITKTMVVRRIRQPVVRRR